MSACDNSLFMRALRRQPIPRTPMWLMRQAGRYLPEYRKVRQQAGNFMSLCKTPELACEVTLQPLRRYSLDAAILFSDILTIPDALGLGLHFIEGEGPCFQKPLSNARAISQLPQTAVINELDYVFAAVGLIRKSLPAEMPLIGFSGSPWTLACYMVEGRSAPGFPQIMHLLKTEPYCIHQLLEKLTEACTVYLQEQINAGVNAVMIFDTWGGLLTTSEYQTFSLAYVQRIIAKLAQTHPLTPVILFTKGGGQWLEAMAATGVTGLGIDWTTSLATARQRTKDEVCLQGNLEPAILLKSEQEIIKDVAAVLASYGEGHGHIFNLGHGITPDVPPENVTILVEAVSALSPQYHKGFVDDYTEQV